MKFKGKIGKSYYLILILKIKVFEFVHIDNDSMGLIKYLQGTGVDYYTIDNCEWYGQKKIAAQLSKNLGFICMVIIIMS